MPDTTPDPGFRPGRMAGPVNVLVCDFDRAICLALRSCVQAFLVQQARELCWSKPLAKARSPLGRNALPDPEPFSFDVPRLAMIGGYSPSIVYRNIKALTKMNILVPADRLNLFINKDYRTWTKEDGSPLLSIDQVEFVKSEVVLGGYRLPLGPPDAHPLVTQTSQGHPNATGTSDADVTKVTQMSQSDANVTRPPHGAGAGSDARSGNSSLQSGEEKSREEGQDAGATGRAPRTLGELRTWADASLDPLEEVAGKLAGWCASYPVEWVWLALDAGRCSARTGGLCAYAASILRDYHAKGGPPVRPDRPASAPAYPGRARPAPPLTASQARLAAFKSRMNEGGGRSDVR